MKTESKIVIGLIACILVLICYVAFNFTKTIMDATKPVEKNENVENIEEKKETTKNLFKEVKVRVNNHNLLAFYIIGEDNETYTLIAKNSVGNTSYNLDGNTTGLKYDIDKFLEQQTNSWTNIGLIRLPNSQEIIKLGDFIYKDNKYTTESDNVLVSESYWLEHEIDSTNTLRTFYVDKDKKSIIEVQATSNYEVLPVIKVIKAYVE